jgi:glycosyltransferase involved in cell wall biosynthesis
MRILVLIHEFPPIGGGGGQVAKDICKELVNIGHEVVLITAHLKGLPREETVDGIRVVRIRSLRREAYGADLLAMGAYILMSLLPAWRLTRSWKPNLIHVHFAVPAGALAWLLSRLTGIPYLLTVHLGDIPGGVPEKTENWFRWFYPLTPPIWRDAACVVAVSDYTRGLAAKHYPVDVRVIPNGVDLASRTSNEIHVGSPPTIIFAGRFVDQKNPLHLVRTLAELHDLPWQCIMLGDGPLRNEVEMEICRHGLQKRFNLPGWITPDQVNTWLSGSDILFMPSRAEGLSVVGLQALGLGLAIVSSRAGGFVDLVEPGGNGYLVSDPNSPEFTSALRLLLADPELLRRFREASREKAKSFDLNKIAADYAQVMAQILENESRSRGSLGATLF